MFTQLAKWIIPACIVLSLFFVLPAQAQDQATISVSGTVISGLTVDAEQDLLFGDIVAGETKRINLDGSATGSSPGEEQAGIFKISTLGSFTASFTDVPAQMVGSGEGNTGEQFPVSFFSAFNTSNTAPEEGNEVSVTANTPIVVAGNGTFQEVFIFLGAEVNPPVAQAQGLYETTITLTATFGID